jgi:hypothetical protein
VVIVPGAAVTHPSNMVPSESEPSIRSNALVAGAAAELGQVTVPDVYDATGMPHDRAASWVTVEVDVHADVITVLVTVFWVVTAFYVGSALYAAIRCDSKLTGVETTWLITAVDVTVRVAVGVKKHVHALLILAVNARPVSLQPATRLLGTLCISVSRLQTFHSTYPANCLFASSSSSSSESFSRFLMALERAVKLVKVGRPVVIVVVHTVPEVTVAVVVTSAVTTGVDGARAAERVTIKV